MRLSFRGAKARRGFYAADIDDNYSPVLEIRFHGGFDIGLTYEQKSKIAAMALKDTARLCVEARKEAKK